MKTFSLSYLQIVPQDAILLAILLSLVPLGYKTRVHSLWFMVSSSYLLTSSSHIPKLCVCCVWTINRFLSNSQRYLCLPQRSKTSNINKITAADRISKGLVVEGWLENWTLENGQVFGHRGGNTFVKLHPLWSIFMISLISSFEFLEKTYREAEV